MTFGKSNKPDESALEAFTSSDVEVNEKVVSEEAPEQVEEPVQVQSDEVTFVPFEDFNGRINQTDFVFKKDVPKKCTRDEANVWLNAKKGYVRD